MTSSRPERPREFVFRKTASRKGRTTFVSPSNSSMRHLGYTRIRLDVEVSKIHFQTKTREVGLICLSGECAVTVDGRSETLRQYDAMYVPRGKAVDVETRSRVDLVECSAEVEGDY